MDLALYLKRIGVAEDATTLKPDVGTLARIMEAHGRAIAFENLDVVLKKPISMAPADVYNKLVKTERGGYCWEQNTLLQMALESLGYKVTPLMARVRWNKPPDDDEHNTTFTHMVLKVELGGGSSYLVDVGFAGTNSMAPVLLGNSEPQSLPEGQYRVVDGTHPRYSQLQLLIKGEWKGLYEWRDERAATCDMECSNWYSCTYPKARFTTSFFVCRVIADERHHILNDTYFIRKGHGVESAVESKKIADRAELIALLENVFGICCDIIDVDAGIDRYLAK